MSPSVPVTPVVLQIGEVELVALLDAHLDFERPTPPEGVSDTELDAGYPDVVGDGGRWAIPVACYLLRSSGTTILVDSGVGPWRNDETTVGHLDEVLEGAGIVRGDVGVVVMTHLHFDHVGWNTVSDGGVAVPFFCEATYLLSSAEWVYLHEEMQRRGAEPPFFTRCVAPLGRANRLRLVEPPFAITSEVSVLAAPGHTPGHTVVRIDSNGQRATIIGDASHHAGQVEHPEWSPLWNADHALASATRLALFDELVDDPAHHVVAGHWGYPGIGHVVSTDRGRRFRAV